MKNEFRDISAMRLKECLDEYDGGKGMTQTELCRRTKIPKSSMSQYINAVNTPTNVKAQLIANVFKVNPVWLMGFDVMKYIPETTVINLDNTCLGALDRMIMEEIQTLSEKEKNDLLLYIDFLKNRKVFGKQLHESEELED